MISSFKKLLGTGRAWRLTAKNINQTCEAFLKPFQDLRKVFYRIAFAPFPSSNSFNDDILGDVENWEKQFGVKTKSLNAQERALNAEAQWSLISGQGFGYIQQVLTSAGLPVKVVENLPYKNFSTDVAIQYNSVDYGGQFAGAFAQYGQGVYRIIGNGNLNIEGNIYDPVKPKNYKNTFLIKGLTPMTIGQYDILEQLLLEVKPMQTLVLTQIELR